MGPPLGLKTFAVPPNFRTTPSKYSPPPDILQNRPQISPMGVVVHDKPQSVRQHVQGLFPGKDAGQFLPQPGTPPQFSTDYDSKPAGHGHERGLITNAHTFSASKAQVTCNTNRLPVRRNGLVRARPDTFPASDTQLRLHHGIFGGKKPDIHDMRSGTPVGTGGDAGPELMVMPDPAFHVFPQERRPS